MSRRGYISYAKKGALILGLFLSIFGWIYTYKNAQKDFPEGENKIAFVLDVSKSMNVEDISGGKSRLSGAKEYIFDTIRNYPGYEYSLTIFAGESQRILPFSYDTDIFFTFLGSLSSQNLTKQGTNISLGIGDALKGFSQGSSGKIIVLTDGDEETIDYSSELVKLLQEKNIQLTIVGFGSQEGGYIPTGDPFSPVKVRNGQRVIAKLNEGELKKYAQSLGGEYIPYTNMLDFSSGANSSAKGRGDFWIAILMYVIWTLFLLSILLEKKKLGKKYM